MHQLGIIGDDQLAEELLRGPNTARPAPIGKPTYDAKSFPNANRLKL